MIIGRRSIPEVLLASRFDIAFILAGAALACAGAPLRPDAPAREMAEVQGQLRAQSALIAEQQRRVEQLEARVAALTAKVAAAPPAAPRQAAAAPAPPAERPLIEFEGEAPKVPRNDPRGRLETVRLEAPAFAKGRRPRRNPVERAPRLSTTTGLREPDEDDVARLTPPRTPVDEAHHIADADRAFAGAVARLNGGDRAGAEADLLAFARRNPQHAAADNAIHLAGLARAQDADCPSALKLFDRVADEYPAGDALPAAQLEAARCLVKLGRGGEARAALAALEKDHPDSPEATQARAMLNGF